VFQKAKVVQSPAKKHFLWLRARNDLLGVYQVRQRAEPVVIFYPADGGGVGWSRRIEVFVQVEDVRMRLRQRPGRVPRMGNKRDGSALAFESAAKHVVVGNVVIVVDSR